MTLEFQSVQLWVSLLLFSFDFFDKTFLAVAQLLSHSLACLIIQLLHHGSYLSPSRCPFVLPLKKIHSFDLMTSNRSRNPLCSHLLPPLSCLSRATSAVSCTPACPAPDSSPLSVLPSSKPPLRSFIPSKPSNPSAAPPRSRNRQRSFSSCQLPPPRHPL